MTARDLQKAFAAADRTYRSEAQEYAAARKRSSGVRRVLIRIAAGLTASAAVFGGLLAAGVWLARDDGINVQTVSYPVEAVTGAGDTGTTTVTSGTTMTGERARQIIAEGETAASEAPSVTDVLQTVTAAGGIAAKTTAPQTSQNTASQTTASTATGAQHTAGAEPQQLSASEAAYDLDGDGYVTWADYMLAYLEFWRGSLSRLGGTAEYKQMLTAEQTALIESTGRTVGEYANYITDCLIEKLDAPGQFPNVLGKEYVLTDDTDPEELKFSITSDLFAYYKDNPEQIPFVTELDRQLAAERCCGYLQQHIWYITELYVIDMYEKDPAMPKGGGYPDTARPITEQQIDDYLDWLRDVSIRLYEGRALMMKDAFFDIDGDGYVTWADYMLIRLESYNRTFARVEGSTTEHPLMLTQKQTALLNTWIGALSIGDVLNCTAEALAGLNDPNAVPAYDSDQIWDYFEAHPEQYGDVTEIDRQLAAVHCFRNGLLGRINEIALCYTVNYISAKHGKERSVVVTAEQVQNYLDFLRDVSIRCYEGRGQKSASETAPPVYQSGDLDMDGYLTYADYMLAWMYQYYQTLPEKSGSYPQMLNAAQIALYDEISTMKADLSQYPAEVQLTASPSFRLDAAVTSLMQPSDMVAKGSLYAQSFEQIGEITDLDRECIRSGCWHGLSDHAYLLGQYYIMQLLPEKYGQSSTDITAEQIDAFLEFLRETCIARQQALGK